MIVEPAPRSSTSGERQDPSFIAVLQESKFGRSPPHRDDRSVHVDLPLTEPADGLEMADMSEHVGRARNPHDESEPPEVPKPVMQRGRFSLRFLLWFTVGAYMVGCMLVMGVLYLTDRFPYHLFHKHGFAPYTHRHGHGPRWWFKHHLATFGLPPPQHPLDSLLPPPDFRLPPPPDPLAANKDPNAIWVRTGPGEDELKSFVLHEGYPFAPPPMAIETCTHLTGSGSVTATKQVYREGFFALCPSLYGAGSVSFVRPPLSRQSQDTVPFAAEVLDSGMGLPDTTQNSSETPLQQDAAHFKPYNVTATVVRSSGASHLLQDLYICPVKLPLYGGGISAFALDDRKLRPLIPDRDGALIAGLDVTVTIPPNFPSSSVGFRAIAPPLPPRDKNHKPSSGSSPPPLVRFVGYVTSSLRSAKDSIIGLMSSRSNGTDSSPASLVSTTSAVSSSP